jgi:tetratricopeptide (TPR) repeat protein
MRVTDLKMAIKLIIVVAVCCFYLPAAAEDTRDCFSAIYALNENRLNEAIVSYTRCINNGALEKRNLIVAYNDRGNAYGKIGDYHEALKDFNKVIELNDRDADAYYNRGLTHKKLSQLDNALIDYSTAIELKPDYAKAYNNRGTIHGEQGHFNHAITDFDRAIDLAADNASAYFNRGLAFYSVGNYQRAISDLEQAIKLDPAYAKAFEHLAWLRATCPDENLRDGQIAVTLAKKARFLTPKADSRIYDIMAAAYATSGNYENARQYQQLAIESAKSQSSTRLKKLDLYQRGEAFEDQGGNRFLSDGT